jgi:hypothetical protein
LAPERPLAVPELRTEAMKVYFAGRYSSAAEMRDRAKQLKALGHEVVSSWIDGTEGKFPEACAIEDVVDLRRADVIVAFTERPRELTNARGGHHVEFGMAHALNKRMIVVGWRQNVFHHLPEVEFYETWNDALTALSESGLPSPQQAVNLSA